MSAVFSTLIVGALLGHGVLAVFIFMAAAMIGVALVVGLYGPKTNALALEEISVDEHGLYRLMEAKKEARAANRGNLAVSCQRCRPDPEVNRQIITMP